jgi:diaminohydroxyphosphoribosylaminopyrimidine deaminase/5-amino-6-(5-phosphoribosylamino)uracil reductase
MAGNDKKYIQRCLDIARLGLGNVAPNPMVGCVIVFEDKIIGEGYHRKIGEKHAEVYAIESVKDKSLLSKSRLYVNLEPCSHFGKTPPCVDLIIKYKIPEIVIGTVDPNEKVKGKGIERLKQAKSIVQTGILENECMELNKRYFTFINKKRPYIILKWAQTLDGFIDIQRNHNTVAQPTWITNETARILVHKWRNEEQAIMAGKNTIKKDNPQLTNRYWRGKSPVRIILDRENNLNRNLNVFDKSADTLIFNSKEDKSEQNLRWIKIDFNENVLGKIIRYLYERGIQSIIIEGGTKLLGNFADINLWDEARIFIGNKLFQNGVKAPSLPGKILHINEIDGSKLIYCIND